MNILKSNNPMTGKKAIAKTIAMDKERRNGTGGPIIETYDQMTVSGAVTKTMILTLIMIAVSLGAYKLYSPMLMYVGIFGGIAVYFLTSFKPHLSPITAPLYAIFEGLFVGTISFSFAVLAGFEGIIFQAISATMTTLLMMLLIYKSGLIKVTQKFRMVVSMCVGAVMMLYLITFIGNISGWYSVAFMHDTGWFGIGVTCVILVIASLNLLLDFDNFETGEKMKAAKHFEWYYAMGLLFTLVWMYYEFLRLFSKIQSD